MPKFLRYGISGQQVSLMGLSTETTPPAVQMRSNCQHVLSSSRTRLSVQTDNSTDDLHLVMDNKKLSYRRETARWVVSVEILLVATQQCRNYLYNKSGTMYQLSLIGLHDKIVL